MFSKRHRRAHLNKNVELHHCWAFAGPLPQDDFIPPFGKQPAKIHRLAEGIYQFPTTTELTCQLFFACVFTSNKRRTFLFFGIECSEFLKCLSFIVILSLTCSDSNTDTASCILLLTLKSTTSVQLFRFALESTSESMGAF